ncbi:MAG: FAD-dependent oxidoreductase [Desulfobacterales bacterium]|nr:FAD-dependent oxidoreductase [Desulfobacterales bacterium]
MRWNHTVDVIVVGAGGAGLAAACEASEAGLKVGVVEKRSRLEETSTALSEGVFSFAGTALQKEKGVEDSPKILKTDLLAHRGSTAFEFLVDAYIENQLETFSWLETLGVKWSGLETGGEMSRPRGHVTDPLEMLRLIEAHLREKGVAIAFSTAVEGLECDSDGSVSGVCCTCKGGKSLIRCRKGVILATGGFGRDTERLKKIDPRIIKAVPVVGHGHEGDGHRMAEKMGACLTDMEYVRPTFGISSVDPVYTTFLVMFYNGAVIVNHEGQRFVDESASYKRIGSLVLQQPAGSAFQVFDQKIYDVGIQKSRGFSAGKAMYGLDARKIPLLTQAQTVGDLGARLGMPDGMLERTITAYNAAVVSGGDEFGRTALAGNVGELVSIDKPPFYAYPSRTMLPGTYGGVMVDHRMRVMTISGEIPGLWAAGEIVGGFHGQGYMTGTAATKALIFGRIAGKSVGSVDPAGLSS